MTETIVNTSEDRVRLNTDPQVNERIRRQIEANVMYYAERLDEIEHRLQELEREWDVERTLQMNFGIVATLSMFLGLFNRKWNILGMLAGAFFIQHAIEGWCPPLPVLRRLGLRTTNEINREKYALKALRGDFAGVTEENTDACSKAARAIQAAHGS